MSRKSEKIPWRTKCCVKGCSTRICSGVSMHGFPKADKYPELYQHWLDAVRLANKTPLWVPLKSNRVCAFHFETVQNTRIRVPTVFPDSELQVPSASYEQSFDDFDLDDDLAADDYEEDPMDVYEDSVAANAIMDEGGSTLPYDGVENTDTAVGYIDEDSSSTYDGIEDTYNAIVGDVVSTLVTDDNIMDDDTNITYGDVEEDAEPTCNSEVEEEEEDNTVCNNVEEEIVYDGGDYMFNDGESSAIQTETFSAEQIGLDQKEFGDDDFTVLVIRHEPDHTEPESTREVLPSKSEVQSQSTQKCTAKKSPSKKSTKKDPCKKPCGMVTVDAAKRSPSSFESSSECAPSEESAVTPEESVLSLSDEVRELLIRGPDVLPDNTHSLKPLEHEVSSKKTGVRSPSKKGRLKSLSQKGIIEPKETLHTNKRPGKVEQKPSPSKGKEEETSPAEELPLEQEVQKVSPRKSKENEMPPDELPDEPEEQKASPIKGTETETSPTEELPVEPEEQNSSPRKDEEKENPRKSASNKIKELNGIKIDELVLDGKPIKLKECSVNILKTPSKLKSNKKPPSALKDKNTPEKKGGEEEKKKAEKKGMVPSGSIENSNFEKDDKRVPESPSEVLNALSLRTSQEDDKAGLRRSARIRAGAGKRRKFGVRRSWSVALKDPPKKKLKVEMDETSQSSESVPYDFENEDDDPEVAASDLEGSDTSASEGGSQPGSNFSSRSAGTGRKPQPKLNGVASKRRFGRLPHSVVAEGENRPKFHGYHRVRLGDQATQVGLPGKCDGFIFDVVRDDPRNVGVSCNVFYHYQPKNYRHHSSWAGLRRNIHPASTAATNITTNPLISIAYRKTEPTKKPVPKAAESKDTVHERQSKDDESNEKPSTNKSKNSAQSKNLERRLKSINRLEDSEEFIEVVDDTHEIENIDSGAAEVGRESSQPENDYILEAIKVEPAMDVSHCLGDADDIEAHGKSHTDIKSMGDTVEFFELEVKEEEEFHDGEELVGADKDSCIVKDLCEVSHNDAEKAGCITISNAFSEPVTEPMETDDTTTAESHAEQFCPINVVEDKAEHYVGNAVSVEAMDTSHGILDQADSGNSSEKTETLEYPHSALASSLSRTESPNRDSNPSTSATNIIAPNMPDIDMSKDSGSEADSLLEDDNMFAVQGCEPGVQNRASDCSEELVGDELMGDQSSTKSNERNRENAAVADPLKFIGSPSEDEMSGSREDIEESNDANTMACPEQAAGCLGDFQLSLKRTSDEFSCVPKDSEDERFGDSHRMEPGCQAECQDADKPSPGEGENEVGECPDATADSGMSAVDDRTSGNSAAENIPQSTDSDNVLAQPVGEAECQNDAENHSRAGQNEDERPYSPDFSSDDSSDSLIEVPIPEVDSEVELVCEIHEGTAQKLLQHSQFRTDENPFVNLENKSNLENSHPQNPKKSPYAAPVSDNPETVPNCTSEEEANPVQSDGSQEVFDSIERNLEKMFAMDR